MDAMVTGNFLSELRKQKGLKQKDVAEKLQISDKAVSRWETGRGIPDVDSLQRLSDFYQVSINEILEGRRIEKNEVEKVADQNLKVMVKKQFSLRKKLFAAVMAMAMAVVVFLVILLAGATVSVSDIGVSIGKSYTVSDDDCMDRVFQDVARLEEAGIEYTIMLDTTAGERNIGVVAHLPIEEKGYLFPVDANELMAEDIVKMLREIGF